LNILPNKLGNYNTLSGLNEACFTGGKRELTSFLSVKVTMFSGLAKPSATM